MADRGMATVLVCLGCTVLLLLTVMVIRVGAAAAARHRAETAADLGALAGAGWVLRGADAACGRAEDVVSANGAALTSCIVAGVDVLVEVRASVAFLGLGEAVEARARAGPAEEEMSR